MMATGKAATGIIDPDDPSRWLVPPWPVQACFGEVVRHFLMAYMWRLQDNTDVRRQLAYFEGYRAALKAAPMPEVAYPIDKQWQGELLACIGECIALST
jgi:hypothetical protein